MGYNSHTSFTSYNGSSEVGEDNLKITAQTKTLFAFGINHKTAPVEIREKLHLRDNEIGPFLADLKSSLSECLVLSTCNRTEVYGVTSSREIDLGYYTNLLIDFKEARGIVRDEHFFGFISCAASQQLFNVATSIDSRVIGDSQILRQLRAAYDTARENGYTGKILNQLFQRAFKLGKTTYTQTSIHNGAVSVSLAAVELGVTTFGSLRDRTALVIGAGEMARFTAEALANKRVNKLIVTNRTRGHAEDLVKTLHSDCAINCEVVDFAAFKESLSKVDVVITSTGSDDPILFADDFAAVDKRILVIDIAVPRDVDTGVGKLSNVVLKNVDDLRSIIDGHHEKRIKDLPKVKRMVVNEMVDFLMWYYSLPIMPEYEKSGEMPAPERSQAIVRVKRFLSDNLSEIHRVAAKSGGNFDEDLKAHFELISKLQALKAEAFAVAAL
ncbi:MAG: glutamyl-tRNA reductase [Acidobacteriota bacterium]